MATSYWVLSLPVQNSPTSLWSRLQESVSKRAFDTPLYRFNIPNLRVGTLDSLLALSDKLRKLCSNEYHGVKYRYSCIVLDFIPLRSLSNGRSNGIFKTQMGGRISIRDELLFRYIFPERPGALMKFMDVFSPRWTLSLFHYRAQGNTGANVLVGIQVAETKMKEFHSRANTLGYI